MPITDQIRILVTHEDPIVAAGLAATLSRHPDFHVMLDDERTSLESVPVPPGARSHEQDIVVTDYRRGFGLAIGSKRAPVTGARSGPRVMIVTPLDREWEVRSAVEVGVYGYLLNGCALEEVVEAVRSVGRGVRYVCRSVAQRMADSLTRERLTGRETEVLELIVAGCCNKTIAAKLDISVGTVKVHVKAVLGKLQAASRTHAAAVAAQRGLVGERPRVHGMPVALAA